MDIASAMTTCPVCGTTIRIATLGPESACPTCGTFIETGQSTLPPTADFIPSGNGRDLLTPPPRKAAPVNKRQPLTGVQATYRFSMFALGIAVLGALLFLCGAIAGDGTPFGLATFSLSMFVAVLAAAALVVCMIDPDLIEAHVPLGLSRLRALLVFVPLAAAATYVTIKTYSP